MTSRQFNKLVSELSIFTMILIERYPDNEDSINDALMDIDLFTNEVQYLIDYIDILISICEEKENFELCAELLKVKNKIK